MHLRGLFYFRLTFQMGVLFSGIVSYFDVRTQTDRHPLTQRAEFLFGLSPQVPSMNMIKNSKYKKASELIRSEAKEPYLLCL